MTQMDMALAARATGEKSKSFLDTVTLGSLTAPVSEAVFLSDYWEKKPLLIKRHNSNYYSGLFSLQDFDTATSHISGYVKMVEATAKKQVRHHGQGATSKDRILSDMHEGSTLVLDSVQEYEPKLGLLCRKLSQQSGFRFATNLYLTPANGKGFTPHWDNHDVFVLQVMGSKHWTVEKNRRVFPEKGSYIPDLDRQFEGDLHTFTLEVGDMVYIPAGYVHAAECGPEPSLHITLGTYPTTLDEFLTAAVKAAVLQDDRLRTSLPFGFLQNGRDIVVERAREAFRRLEDSGFLNQAVDSFRNEAVKRFPLDISGSVVAHFQPKPIELNDRFGLRDGIVCTTTETAEAITVYVGARSVTFPEFFAPALKFSLSEPSFQVRELPGDVEDEERVLFVERLVQEAVLVRK
jgi:ribosomal protein L16 Arg81 hydroxylase